MNRSFMKWFLLSGGVLTLSMLYAVFAPVQVIQSMFGETLTGPVAELLVRNWGALIALSGAMMIYAAYEPQVRPFALTVAGVTKVVFVSLVLSHGQRFLDQRVMVAVVGDSVMVLVFAVYLASFRRSAVVA